MVLHDSQMGRMNLATVNLDTLMWSEYLSYLCINAKINDVLFFILVS